MMSMAIVPIRSARRTIVLLFPKLRAGVIIVEEVSVRERSAITFSRL
jgi:hypothetical protein